MGVHVNGVYVPTLAEVGWDSEVGDFLTRMGNAYVDITQAPYGAVGDDTTDCRGSVQAAVDDVGAAGGGTVFCPLGTYLLTGRIIISDPNVRIVGVGRGTVFKAKAGITNSDQGMFYALDVSATEFRDFDVDGNLPNIADKGDVNNQFGIWVRSGSAPTIDTVVDNVNIYRTWGPGLRLDSAIATSSKTVSVNADSRFVTITSGSVVAADLGKRISIAGAQHISALTSNPAALASFVTDLSDATHFYTARKARTSVVGATLTLYTPYDSSALVTDCEVHHGGSIGFSMGGQQNSMVRNLFVHHNALDGAQLLDGLGYRVEGLRAEANTGNGFAMARCFHSSVNGVDARGNAGWGFAVSLGMVEFGISNVVCCQNWGGFVIDTDENTGDLILFETRGHVSNVVCNDNPIYHGISVNYAEDVTITGATALHNIGGDGIFILGRGVMLSAFNTQDNAQYGINMPVATTLPAQGFHVIGEGTNAGHTTQVFEGSSVAGTVRYTFPHRAIPKADDVPIQVNASQGDRFYASTAASREWNQPTQPLYGQTITLETRNTGGGPITPTFHAVYKLVGGAGPTVGAGKRQSVTFFYDGTNWTEITRTSGDI